MKIADKQLLDKLMENASQNPRGRTMHCFHEYPEDSLQRMINTMCRGSYVRPHRHINPEKREMFFILHGRAAYFEFDDTGKVIHAEVLDAEEGKYGLEITPSRFHTITALSEIMAVFELKDGPYLPINDKNFAPWAPAENTQEVPEYLEKLISFTEKQ